MAVMEKHNGVLMFQNVEHYLYPIHLIYIIAVRGGGITNYTSAIHEHDT